MVLGSLLSGWVNSCGRWRAIVSMQFVIIIVCTGSLVANFWVIISAKFIQGFAAAIIVNTSQLFIVETCPPKELGKFGSVINIGIVTGLSVYFL